MRRSHAGRRRSRTKDLFEIRSTRLVPRRRYLRGDRRGYQPALGESVDVRVTGIGLDSRGRRSSRSVNRPIQPDRRILLYSVTEKDREHAHVPQRREQAGRVLFLIFHSSVSFKFKRARRASFQISRLHHQTEN